MIARHLLWIAPLLAFAACADEPGTDYETATPAYDATGKSDATTTETVTMPAPETAPPAVATTPPVTGTEPEPMGKPVPASAAKDDEATVTTTPATSIPPAQASVSQEAREFVRKAGIGGLFEVQSSQLAVERATSPALQDTAKMLIRDHQQANDQLRAIAMAKGISVPTTLDSEHQRMMDDLRNLQGEAFDKEFHRMQVDAHEKAIDLFEDAGENLKEPELKDFAQKTLPTLKAHLDELNANPVGG
ncbi:MAG TPA: DUF4142 domain-containing protein [Planctomycetota bacterium]|nr:DUF4142 domain-containing protein [Planctomycetota bacterium]